MVDGDARLKDDISPIVVALGFQVVEIGDAVIKGRRHVSVVIYRAEGISADDCAEVHKTLMPRLEVLLDDRDIALQVASPGVDRVLKDTSELAVFRDRGIRILRRCDNTWVAGTILNATDREVQIRTSDGTITVDVSDVHKAKLDYSQEVR